MFRPSESLFRRPDLLLYCATAYLRLGDIMDTEDYLSKMPFVIAFIDPLQTDFQAGSDRINAQIRHYPLAHARLHQPHFAEKILEMAANRCNMRIVVRKADAQIKHDLHYIIRKGVFASDEKMWAFINHPDNLELVKQQ